jgi:hypothetical protein
MGEIVNLRRARKSRKRAEDERVADANRVAFGRTKVERSLSDTQKALDARRLDGHQLRASLPHPNDEPA